MFKIVSKEEAAAIIKPGDCIGLNCFLALGHADVMYEAIRDSFIARGEEANLTLICSAGFGNWNETDYGECLTSAGMVKRVFASHYASMPVTRRLVAENKIEGYVFPLGALSHWMRSNAAGNKGVLSKVGLGIYVDPRHEGAAMNDISKGQYVSVKEIEGEEYLYYTLPPMDIALIKGTAVDPNGNITFDNECVTIDALAMAQAVRRNGGKVIVQVDKTTHVFSRPRNVIVPGALVDMVVVEETDSAHSLRRTLSGDIHVAPNHMNYWVKKFSASSNQERDVAASIIGRRGARELKKGDIVNVGIGLPTAVCQAATETDIMRDIYLTVESGGLGGLPVSGHDFGASIGSDMSMDMSVMFDFYDGGGLDICFMGGLEVDQYGNVNVHLRDGSFVGIGGFGNITAATKDVVFCLTFNTKGLQVEDKDGEISILKNGSIPKFHKEIPTFSFSAEQALKNGQNVIYITERCVFKLVEGGLKLIEVYPGVDRQKDVIDLLDFPLVD